MNCPTCGQQMEVEHLKMITLSPGSGRAGRSVSAAHYRCENCDAEWNWIKGVGLTLIDSASGGEPVPLMVDDLIEQLEDDAENERQGGTE